MNYLVQRGKIRSQVINVPEGLPELLSDITREVLRCQPTTECLCQFIIDYLHSLIVTRDKARMAKMIIDRALRTVDEVIADMCICDIDKTKADQMSAAMEECFKRFLAQRRCEKGRNIELIKFNEFDMLDELIQKCKFSEDELKISRPMVEAAYQKFVDAYMTAQENTEGTEALYQYFRERELKRIEERIREQAAIKIQANFRGYRTRRSLFLSKEIERPTEEPFELGDDILKQEAAARKIQRFFRRHMSFLQKQEKMALEYADEFQDVCKPESKISLTARVPGYRDTKEHLPDEERPDGGGRSLEETQMQIENPEERQEVDEIVEDVHPEERSDGGERSLEETQTQIENLEERQEVDEIVEDVHPGEVPDSADVTTMKIYQEVVVDGEVVYTHEEIHTIAEEEHAIEEDFEE